MLQVVLRQNFPVYWWNPDDILIPGMVTEQNMMLQVVLQKSFNCIAGKKLSGSHLSLILWFLYKANFPSWIFKKWIDLLGFLPRGAFIPAKKPGVQFN